jgi:hypothetical protein
MPTAERTGHRNHDTATRRESSTCQNSHLDPPWLPTPADLVRRWARNGPGVPAPTQTHGSEILRRAAHHLTRSTSESGQTGTTSPHATPDPTRAVLAFNNPTWPKFTLPATTTAPGSNHRSGAPCPRCLHAVVEGPRRGSTRCPHRSQGAAPSRPREGEEDPGSNGREDMGMGREGAARGLTVVRE